MDERTYILGIGPDEDADLVRQEVERIAQEDAEREVEEAMEFSLVELLVDRLLSPHPSEEVVLWIPR